MMWIWIIIGVFVYLVIGRIVAEKMWEKKWDKSAYPGEAHDDYEKMILKWVIFWPFGLLWELITLIASIFVDI